MENKKAKLRKWYEDHKEGVNEVICIGRCVLFVGVGYIVGSKFNNHLASLGMARAHDLGVIKLFDPDTNLEISFDEAVEVMKRLNKK